MNQMNQELPLIETVHLKKYFDTGSGLLHAVPRLVWNDSLAASAS